MGSLSQHLLRSTIQGKDMNTNDDEDKICPHCRKTFSSLSARNKHLWKNVCHNSVSRTPVSSRNPPPPALPPAILLKEDHEGLLMGHNCPYSKYRISQLLNITNTEVYPLLSHCTIPGGINVCPTTDTDRVRLKVLLAAKNHRVNQISVPKTVPVSSGGRILDISAYLKPNTPHKSWSFFLGA